jgi:pyroglutamyl-peptidase
MKTILMTGFGPFGNVEKNPSQALIEELNLSADLATNAQLKTEILPVIYGDAVDRIRALIHEHEPDFLISFGVAARRENVCPERVALNLKDTQQPDNAGNTPEGELIFSESPLAYFSNLPLLEIRDFLQIAGIPTEISNHAGAYICNAVFFAAAHEIETTGRTTEFGFIHIPLMPLEAAAGELSTQKLANAVVDLIGELV